MINIRQKTADLMQRDFDIPSPATETMLGLFSSKKEYPEEISEFSEKELFSVRLGLINISNIHRKMTKYIFPDADCNDFH